MTSDMYMYQNCHTQHQVCQFIHSYTFRLYERPSGPL